MIHEHEALELASAALDFELTPAESRALAEALADCPVCAERAAAYRTQSRRLAELPLLEVSDRTRRRVTAAALSGRAPSRPGLPPQLQLLAAALLLGLILAGVAAVGAMIDRSAPPDLSVADPSAPPAPSVSPSMASPSPLPSPSPLASLTPGPSASPLPSPSPVQSPPPSFVAEEPSAAPARTLTPTIPAVPANDEPPGIAIAELPFADTTNTTRAEIHAMEGASTCGSGSRSVWYGFTAPSDAVLVADTIGSDYDTILDVWEGALVSDRMSPGFETLTPLVCSDDTGDSVQSEVVFEVVRDRNYVIRISAGLESSGGSLMFHLGPA